MIGSVVSVLTDFRPLVMGMFMGAIFAALIVSPVSSVGIAMAIGIEGIASGSANLGITAGALTLAIMSSRVNGFGSTGLIGPLAAYQNMASGPITIVFLVAIFVGMPLLLGYLMRYIFIQKLAFVKEEDLLVKIE